MSASQNVKSNQCQEIKNQVKKLCTAFENEIDANEMPSVIGALSHIISFFPLQFENDPALAKKLVTSILHFCLLHSNNKILYETNPIYQLSFHSLGFLNFFSIKERNFFMNDLLECIKGICEKKKVFLPDFQNKKKNSVNVEPDDALNYYLFYCGLYFNFFQYSESILDILKDTIVNKSYQTNSLFCLSNYVPLRVSTAYQELIFIAQFVSNNNISEPLHDSFLAQAFSHAFSTYSNYYSPSMKKILFLLGKKLLEYINFIPSDLTLFANQYFRIIKILIQNDSFLTKMLSPIISKLFSKFYNLTYFTDICKEIINSDPNFGISLENYFNNHQCLPTLAKILANSHASFDPYLKFIKEKLKEIKIDILYEILLFLPQSLLSSSSYFIFSYLTSGHGSTTPTPPPEHLLPTLFTKIFSSYRYDLNTQSISQKTPHDSLDPPNSGIKWLLNFLSLPNISFKPSTLISIGKIFPDIYQTAEILKYIRNTFVQIKNLDNVESIAFFALVSTILLLPGEDQLLKSIFDFYTDTIKDDYFTYSCIVNALLDKCPDKIENKINIDYIKNLVKEKPIRFDILKTLFESNYHFNFFFDLLREPSLYPSLVIYIAQSLSINRRFLEDDPFKSKAILYEISKKSRRCSAFLASITQNFDNDNKLFFSNDLIGYFFCHSKESYDEYITTFSKYSGKNKNLKNSKIVSSILVYFFSHYDKENLYNKIVNLKKDFQIENISIFLLEHSKIFQKLFLNLGNPSGKIRTISTNNIKVYEKMNIVSTSSKTNDRFLTQIFVYCSKILKKKFSYKQYYIIPALKNLLKFFDIDIYIHYPSIIAIIKLAGKNPSLHLDCLEFWSDFLDIELKPLILESIFGNIISQVIPYYSEYPEKVSNVIKKLVENNNNKNPECFKAVCKLSSVFEDYHQLLPILKKIEYKDSQCSKINDLLKMQLQYPQYDTLLLQQIRVLLLENQSDLLDSGLFIKEEDHDYIDFLFSVSNDSINPSMSSQYNNLEKKPEAIDIKLALNVLWSLIYQRKNTKIQLLACRCLSLLPYSYFDDFGQIDKVDPNNLNQIKRTIIFDYLVKFLEENKDTNKYYLVVYVIQELLKDLDFENFTDEEKSLLPYHKQGTLLVKTDESNLNDRISNFIKNLMNSVSNSPFECCKMVMILYHPLSHFLIPYIIYHHFKENRLKLFLRSEFSKLLCDLQSHSQNESEQDLKFFKNWMINLFYIFNCLNIWNISISTNRGGNLFYNVDNIEIGNDDEIYELAFSCELWARALFHLERSFIFYKKRISNDNLTREDLMKLLSIYDHIDDVDTRDYLQRTIGKYPISNEIDELELVSLKSDSKPEQIVKYFEHLLKSGRFERILIERNGIQNNVSEMMDNKLSKQLNAIFIAAALRLQKWNEMSSLFTESSQNFNNIYDSYNNTSYLSLSTYENESLITKALLDIRMNKITEAYEDIERARLFFINQLENSNTEGLPKRISILNNFRMLEEIEICAKAIENHSPKLPEHWIKYLQNWTKQPILTLSEAEKTTAIHTALVSIIPYIHEKKRNSSLSKQWLNLAKASRKECSLDKAMIYVLRASQFLSNKNEPSSNIQFEKAKIYYARHQNEAALALLDNLLQKSIYQSIQEEKINDNIKDDKGLILFLKAKWSESVANVETMQKYFQESASLTNNGKAYLELASISDLRVTSYVDYLQETHTEMSPTTNRHSSTMNFCLPNSKSFMLQFIKEQLPLTVENYLLAIKVKSEFAQEIIPRLLHIIFDIGRQLVFSSPSFGGPKLSEPKQRSIFSPLSRCERKAIIDSIINTVDNYIDFVKENLLDSLTQLISRIEQPGDLQHLLFKMIMYGISENIEQGLWQILSLKNSISEERQKKFTELMEYLNSQIFIPPETLSFYENLTKQLIEISSQNCSEENFKKLYELFNSRKVVLPQSLGTAEKMDKTIITIRSKQTPHKICLKVNGDDRFFLLKNDDDLRKDMRMMEFSLFMNKIFQVEHRSRQRNLNIIAFHVVCLNERNGMIEWVQDTICFRKIVEDLYLRMGVGLKEEELKQLLIREEHEDEDSIQKRQYNFVNFVLPKYPGVLHMWFEMTFRDVKQWYERRLTYVRSLAVWSMVGYIAGLGDRHAENILFQEKSGSIVMVDFSCLFDKGKTFEVPEVVPFRLTNNLVDAMGVLETKGSFECTCIIVSEIMREKRKKLMSVLQTFYNDPLLEWKKGPRENTEIFAKMTVKEMDRRIAGLSEDNSTMNSSCIVKELIKQATDPANLSQMYINWQPYL